MKKFIYENKKTIFLSVLIMLISFALSLKNEEEALIENGSIERKQSADESISVSALYDGVEYEDLELKVSGYRFSEKEFNEILDEGEDEMIRQLLSENESTEKIETDLNFFTGFEEYPFSFEWRVEDAGLLDEEGRILSGDAFNTTVYLTVSYLDYTKDLSFRLYVNPDENIKERVREEKILSTMEISDTLTKDERYFVLPSEIDGKPVTFTENRKSSGPIYMAVGFAISVGLFIAKEQDKKKILKQRKEDILWEYPIVLQNMSMYLSAGMSVRNVWKKIVSDSQKKKNRNPIYEEMEITLNEMDSGISELTAYERFGERIKIPELTRFMALLSQNVKRGSSKLSKILSDESGKAFDEMKYKVRKKGEEAGTKLLLPMMTLLVMVMAIIMVPAFFNL